MTDHAHLRTAPSKEATAAKAKQRGWEVLDATQRTNGCRVKRKRGPASAERRKNADQADVAGQEVGKTISW